ncbi:release factor glutamine methyltransferase [Nocardioides marinisabuli]|uniref:Release factor glutamine methyltransferase n=1 Tax=Nocardioides marinisabuli TaxID=419476 RepID=A0A7Y9F2A4_9ACTN|nr:methyltransferase [Nocardioides marinisabuli]NYD57425.1 release factor glutamine methyltransferase [Nocardioides marinisabuli]
MPESTVQQMTFGPLTITYDDSVLEPRPWTRAQSLWARELLDDAPAGRVLELCAGVGHIGLLAVHGTDRSIACVDLSPRACELLGANAAANAMAGQVEVVHSDLARLPLDEERFALVVADPPWVPTADIGRYPADPALAIDGGPQGLDVARACVRAAGACLVAGGTLVLQVGTPEQAAALAPDLEAAGLATAEVRALERGTLVRADRR